MRERIKEGGEREKRKSYLAALLWFVLFSVVVVAGLTIRCPHLVWSTSWLAAAAGGERYTAGHRRDQKEGNVFFVRILIKIRCG